MIPLAGSAYTYAYATLGEIIAWIMGGIRLGEPEIIGKNTNFDVIGMLLRHHDRCSRKEQRGHDEP